ncbi:MAG: YceI family protein [Steroidobacterales bacterium]
MIDLRARRLLPLALLGTLGSLCTADASAAHAYSLDAAHASVSFSVRRLGIPWITARFEEFTGDFIVARTATPELHATASRVDVDIRSDSILCTDARWNARLRSREWLDTGRFPRTTYHSRRIDFGAAGHAVASGELTLHGITRPVALTISRLDCVDAPADTAQGCAFAAQARISRSEFGLPHGFWVGGDQVEISIRGVGTPRRTP